MKKLLLSLVLMAAACNAQTPPSATVTATLGGQTASVQLQLLPATQLSLISNGSSPLSVIAGQTANFNVNLNSSCSAVRPSCLQPAGVQFTLNAPSAAVSGFTVTAGPVVTAAGKTLQCAVVAPGTTGVTAINCLVAGLNNNGIANGTLASVAVQTVATATGSAAITGSSFSAANVFANSMSIVGSALTTVLSFTPTLSLTAAQGFIEPGEVVVLTAAVSSVSSGAQTIALASDHTGKPGVIVPASVTLNAGQSSVTVSAVGQ